MADGRVVIDVVVNDEQLKKLDGSLGTVEKSTGKVATGAKNMTAAMLAVKAVSKVFDAVSQSLDAAISRFDTMKQYPRVMEMIGFSTEQSERSVRRLAEGIEGLPTRLDEVVGTAQGLALITDDINYATDLTLGLNNAFLASGASAGDASRGLVQYQQMLATGKADMQSWRTLQETMPVALRMTAEAFGYAGSSATNDFYEALRDGDITFEQFGDKIIELSNQTGGFADMAMESSKGIATSMQNVKTAVVNGLTVVIEAFENMLREVTGKGIAEHLDNLKQIVRTVFKAIGTSIEQVTPIVKFFYEIFKTVINFIAENTEIVVGLVTAFAMFKIIESVNGWMTTLKGGLETLYLVLLDVTSGTNTFLGALSGIGGSVGNFASILGSVPGMVSLAIGATVGLAVKFHNDQKKRIEEMAAVHNEKAQEMLDAQKEFSNAVQQSIDDHETQRGRAIRAADGLKSLAEETFALAEQQGRTGAETKQLEENINELNDAIGQEVIFYNEKTGAISTTAGELNSYLDLMKAENQLALEKERQVEVDEQLVEATKNRKLAQEAYHEQQREIYKLEQEKQELDHTGNMTQQTQSAHRLQQIYEEIEARQQALEISREAYEEARNSENDLIEQKEDIAGRTEQLYADMADAESAYMAAVEENKIIRITSLDQLTEADRAYVEGMKDRFEDIKTASTNMFEKINTDSEMTSAQMLETLKHNQQAVSDWSSNLESLGNRTLSNNQKVSTEFVEYLRNMGTDGAAIVAELVNATDAELIEFSNIFETQGQFAGESLAGAMDIPKEELPEGIWELITETDTGLTEGFNSIDWDKYGETMGLGLVEGIESQSENVSAAGEGIAKDSIKGVKGGLESYSPSRAAAREGVNLADGLIQGINKSKNKVIQTAESLSKQIMNSFKVNFGDSRQVTTAEFTEMNQIVQTQLNQMKNAVNTSLTGIKQLFTSSYSQMRSTQTRELTSMVSTATSRLNQMNSTATSMLNQMVNYFRSTISNIKSTVATGFQYVANQIKTHLTSAVTTARTMTSQVGSAMYAGVSAAKDAGYYTGIGFRDGLASTRSSVMSTARSIANAASNTIKSSLKISSPSGVTEDYGSFTGEGFAIGLQGWVNKVARIANILAGSAVPNFNPNSVFGIANPAYAGAGSSVSNVQHSSTNDNRMILHVDKLVWTGEKDIRQTMDEIGFINSQEQWRLDNG